MSSFLICLLASLMATSTAFTFNKPPPFDSSTALVTGSTDGIGLTTAKNLAKKGYNVIIHGRNPERIQHAIDTVSSFDHISKEKIFSVESDISSLQGCNNLVNQVQSIIKSNNLSLDILMNNAGAFEGEHVLTDDNLETTFAVNVMAPFVITSNLLPELLQKNNRQSRVVIASSMSQCRGIDDWDDLQCMERPFSTHRAYAESKLFDAILTAQIATILESNGFGSNRITCNSLDPGTVNTKMLLAGWGPIGIDVESALDETWLCSSEEVSDTSGTYFCWKIKSKDRAAYKPSEREKLWKVLSDIDPSSASKWDKIHDFL
jgi:NAD(P)-dependent dehydrogenase (short-subunit alcohol dehydrogenase family)